MLCVNHIQTLYKHVLTVYKPHPQHRKSEFWVWEFLEPRPEAAIIPLMYRHSQRALCTLGRFSSHLSPLGHGLALCLLSEGNKNIPPHILKQQATQSHTTSDKRQRTSHHKTPLRPCKSINVLSVVPSVDHVAETRVRRQETLPAPTSTRQHVSPRAEGECAARFAYTSMLKCCTHVHAARLM